VYDAYFHAKLLLTAEYLVLNGATALAVPLKFGQRLQVEDHPAGFIAWHSLGSDGQAWFTAEYSTDTFEVIRCSDPAIAQFPQRLLTAARNIRPDFLEESPGCRVLTRLDYPLEWGLGSSSTLIAAVAGWAGIDPYRLHFSVSSGSGYDIACALASGPVLYTLAGKTPAVEPVRFAPAFADRIFLVYLGRKQDSAEGIKTYRAKVSHPDSASIIHATALTHRMLQAETLDEFNGVINEHESLISDLIGAPELRDMRFPDLPGAVKSLGAWGGDFCMLTWESDPELLPAYLERKGCSIRFNFSEIVL
jgi:mevalonate kinase